MTNPPPLDTRELRGPVLDVYGSFEVALRQIGATHPYALRFQGWPERLARAIERARALWPELLVGIAPGCDPVARRYRQHHDVDRAVGELVGIADRTVALGVGHLAWDAEAAWKGSTTIERANLACIATEAIRQVRAKHPALRQSLTSYGWPVSVHGVGGHGTFCWRGWLPGEVTYIGQTYERGRGRLVAGEAVAIESYHQALAAGMMAPGTPRLVEIQTHHNVPSEIATVGTSTEATFFWAAGNTATFDADGARGWRACLALWRAGYWGGGAVERFQASAGLKVDGIAGPRTLAALGVT